MPEPKMFPADEAERLVGLPPGTITAGVRSGLLRGLVRQRGAQVFVPASTLPFMAWSRGVAALVDAGVLSRGAAVDTLWARADQLRAGRTTFRAPADLPAGDPPRAAAMLGDEDPAEALEMVTRR